MAARRPREPSWGWQGRSSALRRGLLNPRAPSVPHSLADDLTLEDYFTASALIGVLAAQYEQPDHKWVEQETLAIGARMAAAARRRRIRRVKKSKS